ncbi:RNA-binding protein 48 [Teleopsis dalmanni]|uniref:RNA-binding protein 48 n=1 Tax=Teleopsis dalmanni TaxID=139649 RepID=UPI0018CF289C|nr:RNA-binding protein 48 [Teleopsis dalmanni]
MCSALEHHKQQEYCRTRLTYRQGKELKAVKVYTVANESSHLLIFGVPKVNLQNEVKTLSERYGTIEFCKCVTKEMCEKIVLEQFTDVFHVKYNHIERARRAKRFIDRLEFYGGILHVSYAPELETALETRLKLQKRIHEINHRLKKNQQNSQNL